MVLSRSEPSPDVLPRHRADLLFCCAICTRDANLVRQAVQSREEPIDWPGLIQIARSNRLEMLLFRAANSCAADWVDPSALELLRQLYADNVARCQARTDELLRLLDRFAREAIPALAFKGPVLGAQFYGDPALRIYADLDVLVRECDIAKVSALMLELDYIETGMDLNWERSFVREGGESVDVHWAIADRVHQFPLSADELWARRAIIPFAGTSLATLCAEDALLAICFNGLTEDWQRCDRIADVAELMRNSGAIDWVEFLGMCRRRGCERVVLAGLHLAKELFLVNLPEPVDARLRAHRRAFNKLGYAIDDFVDFVITSTDRRAGSDYWRHVIGMRERRWEKVPYYQSLAYSWFRSKDDDAPWQRTSRLLIYRMLRLPMLGIKHGLRWLGHASFRETPRP